MGRKQIYFRTVDLKSNLTNSTKNNDQNADHTSPFILTKKLDGSNVSSNFSTQKGIFHNESLQNIERKVQNLIRENRRI